ncbi:hypothetical protein JZ751_029318 [Albula glossodonta]|uniref:Uncharacterized protein n=1 Tax=Albula glossodonta TaxID=121402 RepID=A0A8T2PCR9_9TELE|nr:hypothetical protein JZ751_029318 [Albula glossodonta]
MFFVCFSEEKRKLMDLNGKTSKEEVLYATIDHGDADRQRTVVNNDDDGCDYAVINIPSGPAQKAAIREDCTDDYVLMS